MGAMAVDPTLRAQIRAARERRHLTQQELADILGVDRKTVDNWENGRTSPRNRMGALIAWAPELGGVQPEPWEIEIRSLKHLSDEEKEDWIVHLRRTRLGEPAHNRAS